MTGVYSREGLIVEYLYKGNWKHVNCVFGYSPRPVPPDGEIALNFMLQTINSSKIQNMEPGEICTERISHIIRVFEWDKDPDELETVDLKSLANGFQVCVVNEGLFRLHRSSTLLQ